MLLVVYIHIEGARTAGVKKVLIPFKQNQEDFNKIKNDKNSNINFDELEIIMVENIHQVIDHFIIFHNEIKRNFFL